LHSSTAGDFNWGLFDLPPSDYHMFTYLNWLRSQYFNSNKELLEGVKTWLNSQPADFFDMGIQKLIPQYDKCLNYGIEYVEKRLKYVHIFSIY
jgi:hypothetical protein